MSGGKSANNAVNAWKEKIGRVLLDLPERHRERRRRRRVWGFGIDYLREPPTIPVRLIRATDTSTRPTLAGWKLRLHVQNVSAMIRPVQSFVLDKYGLTPVKETLGDYWGWYVQEYYTGGRDRAIGSGAWGEGYEG